MKKSLILLAIFPCLVQAQIVDVHSAAAPPAIPVASLSVSPATLTCTSIAGTQGLSQSYTITGANLATNFVTVTAPAGYVVSKDNSSFSGTQTVSPISGSINQVIYVALGASNSAGTNNGSVSNDCPGASLIAPVTVNGTTIAPSAAIFNFSASSNTVAGATNVFGDPTGSQSFTDLTTGWTLAVRGAGWTKFGGTNYGGVGNGATAASSDGTFTQPQIGSNLYNIASYSSGQCQLEFTNLPQGTYALPMLGSIPNSVFPNSGNCEIHVVFGTGADNYKYYDPNNGTASTGNITTAGPGAVTSGSFTGTITAGQTIKVWVVKGTAGGNTGALGYINALKIVKTN